MYDVNYIKEHYPLPPLSIVVDCGFPVCYGESGILDMEFQALEEAPEWLFGYQGGKRWKYGSEYAEITLKKDSGEIQTWKASGKAVHTGVAETRGKCIVFFAGESKKSGEGQRISSIEISAGAAGSGTVFRLLHEQRGKAAWSRHSCWNEREKKVTFHLDIRYPILDGNGQLTDGGKLQKCLEESSGLWSFGDLVQKSAPVLLSAGQKKEVKALENAFRKFGGYTDSNYCMSGGTYARALPQAFAFWHGYAGEKKKLYPELSVGGDYHQPNESLNIEEYMKAITLLIACLAELDKSV